MLDLRAITADEWQLWRGLRHQALAEAPDAFSSSLPEWEGANDIEDRWRRRLTTVPLNIVAYLDDAACGMVSASQPNANGSVELISMWVAPSARGQRVGDALIAAVVDWSHARGARQVELEVFDDNERALKLYERCGFVADGSDDGVIHMILRRPKR